MSVKKRGASVFVGELANPMRIPKNLDANAAAAHYAKEFWRKFERLTESLSQRTGLVWPQDAAQMFVAFVMDTPGFQFDTSRRGPEQEKWGPAMKRSLQQDYRQVKAKYGCRDIEALEHLRTKNPYRVRWGRYTLANLESRLPEAKSAGKRHAKALGRALRNWRPTNSEV